MTPRIPTTKPTILGTEIPLLQEALNLANLNGKGKYTRLCEQWLEKSMPAGGKGKAILVSPCTSALELAAILANIQPGDEIIVQSYTYVSTVNSVLRGAVPVFVDLDDKTLNIDLRLIEDDITAKTRVIVPVHYRGHGLLVVEDAAMACTSLYKDRMLGTIGHIGYISFQEKKNFTAGGQGGAILVNDSSLIERARILYEHGTNRGQVERHDWLDLGINATLSELQAAFLHVQLQAVDTINTPRLHRWHKYHSALTPLAEMGHLILPTIPSCTTQNANIFWIQVREAERRKDMIQFLDAKGIETHPLFMPLHSGMDRVTTLAAAQILLLPLFVGMTDHEQQRVVEGVSAFFGTEGLSNVV
ncbi:putative pyridoxal phosphate-dependent enzyme [Aspergillus homomorphus CBS 101889]|uniref:Putative pyridoxal phosphate-dependent enzyme n=1 Tax=Aspergillus homomorphus (strain CBS 101889) TaxID=1450537 RepID=A0A395HXE0_ASPHC|nr:putative pyridoxal phosphate-dependent enzyme [Aspergillus homomorphus CBS 101889]RAL12581.1 putative pyridoxal phosphate-dependent enzyme [Aspergillus homomorphus CBS 101889]